MDIKQAITNRVFQIINHGRNEKTSWAVAAKCGFPVNARTGKAFRGFNALLLWAQAAQEGYASNLWLTLPQIDCLDAKVKSEGERAVMVTYGKAGECRATRVYNVAQIDGLPAELLETAIPTITVAYTAELAKTIAQIGAYVRRTQDDPTPSYVEFHKAFKAVDFFLTVAAAA